MTYPTSNTTSLHPAAGFVLAEFLEIEDTSMIKVPDQFKSKAPDETKQRIIVLEDSRYEHNGEDGSSQAFAPGTRILTTTGDGISHQGRKLLLVKIEDIKGWFDTAE